MHRRSLSVCTLSKRELSGYPRHLSTRSSHPLTEIVSAASVGGAHDYGRRTGTGGIVSVHHTVVLNVGVGGRIPTGGVAGVGLRGIPLLAGVGNGGCGRRAAVGYVIGLRRTLVANMRHNWGATRAPLKNMGAARRDRVLDAALYQYIFAGLRLFDSLPCSRSLLQRGAQHVEGHRAARREHLGEHERGPMWRYACAVALRSREVARRGSLETQLRRDATSLCECPQSHGAPQPGEDAEHEAGERKLVHQVCRRGVAMTTHLADVGLRRRVRPRRRRRTKPDVVSPSLALVTGSGDTREGSGR